MRRSARQPTEPQVVALSRRSATAMRQLTPAKATLEDVAPRAETYRRPASVPSAAAFGVQGTNPRAPLFRVLRVDSDFEFGHRPSCRLPRSHRHDRPSPHIQAAIFGNWVGLRDFVHWPLCFGYQLQKWSSEGRLCKTGTKKKSVRALMQCQERTRLLRRSAKCRRAPFNRI